MAELIHLGPGPESRLAHSSSLIFMLLLVFLLQGVFPGGSVVKNLPANPETWVQSLLWEDSLEKEMAIHSSILVWEIPWAEEPGRLQSMGSHRVRHN